MGFLPFSPFFRLHPLPSHNSPSLTFQNPSITSPLSAYYSFSHFLSPILRTIPTVPLLTLLITSPHSKYHLLPLSYVYSLTSPFHLFSLLSLLPFTSLILLAIPSPPLTSSNYPPLRSSPFTFPPHHSPHFSYLLLLLLLIYLNLLLA